MEMLSNWNQERVRQLETLYRDGLSFSLIAADIGVTRNAAIGKAHRMKLPKRVEIVQCKAYDRSKAVRSPRRGTFRSVAIKTKSSEIVPNYDYNCTIYELRDTSCRWPLWGASTPHAHRLYCGVPDASVSKDVPYCRRHRLMCDEPSRKLNAA